jgi:DMSO/TMAO reductase YedYZ heme-binding membrane subunit
MHARRQPTVVLSGPNLTLLLSALLVALALSLLVWRGTGEEGIRTLIRVTARTSLALFLPAYAASALLRIRPSTFSRWLMKNRRWVGLSFAVSHALHLLGIIALKRTAADFELSITTLIFGGMAYVFIALMAATSSDAAVRALGSKRWQRLHRIGMHWIWAIFFLSYAPRAASGSPGYILLTLFLVAALGLRLFSARLRPVPATAPAQSSAANSAARG